VANMMPFSIRTPGSADAGEASAESTTSASAIVANTGLSSRWLLITPVCRVLAPSRFGARRMTGPSSGFRGAHRGVNNGWGARAPQLPHGRRTRHHNDPLRPEHRRHTDEPAEARDAAAGGGREGGGRQDGLGGPG